MFYKNEVSNQEERDENMQKIEKLGSNFLKVLNEAGKVEVVITGLG